MRTVVLSLVLAAAAGFAPVNSFARVVINEVMYHAPDDLEDAKAKRAPTVELTYNWDPEDYAGGRNFGHLAYAVDDIYATCQRLMDGGVVISRPPRDGRMAFVRSPDNISIELLQKGQALAPAEPWTSMPNVGAW